MPKITVELAATDLPPSAARKLPGGPVPGMRYRVTVEEIEDEATKLAALRADLAHALAQADAGELLDEDEVFRDLDRKFPPA